MSNSAHEALLRQGLEDWNEWRELNPQVVPDLEGVVMPAADLRGADLSRARLAGATLICARLDGSDLRYADLRDARLHEVDLSDANLFRANLERAFLPGAKLRRSRLFGANLRHAQVTVADFREADLREADLGGADFRESLGSGALLERARLSNTELRGCTLAECTLEGALGLDLWQLETAILDATTILPEGFETGSAEPPIQSLRRAFERLKARATGPSIPDTVLASYHGLLHKLELRGIDTRRARVEPAYSSRGRSAGGQAQAAPSHGAVDAALFRAKIDCLLNDVGFKVDLE